jgi:type I restriction-modification system DNA methylase subunit
MWRAEEREREALVTQQSVDSVVKITSPDQSEILKHRTVFGREKDNAIYPIALANLILHNIDEPHIWHGNTLTGAETSPEGTVLLTFRRFLAGSRFRSWLSAMNSFP